MKKYKVARTVIISLWVILGSILLICINTLGERTNLRPTLTLLVRIYIALIPICIGLLIMLKRRIDKKEIINL